MAKKEKVQLTPEELAAKKLKTKKNWARVGAVALALAITAAIYVLGAKDGPKKETEVLPTAAPVVNVVEKKETTTKAPETTTAPATTKADDSVTTTKASSSDSSSSDILGQIKDGLGSLLGGLGDLGGGGASLPSVDTAGAADTVEQVGGSIQDFFYGIADKIEADSTTTTTVAQ